MTPEVAEYYDRYWSAEETPRYEPAPELWSLLEDAARPGAAILDVGCGAANSYAPRVAARASSYVGVDVSGAAIKLARLNGLDARQIDDAGELPFADESFDAAICIEVLEHLLEPDRAAAEVHRVLRPGGTLLVSAPNAVYWRFRAEFVLGRWDPRGDPLSRTEPWRDPHIRFFSPSLMKRMLHGIGFRDVEVGAHGGRLLDHISERPTAFGQSPAYRMAERRFPSLLGLTIHGRAVR
jgi:SAM-dependent methyltransferase